jgi:hypothetical protein
LCRTRSASAGCHSFQRFFHGDRPVLGILSDDAIQIFREHFRFALCAKLPAPKIRDLFCLCQQFLVPAQIDFGGYALRHVLRNPADQPDGPTFVFDWNRARQENAGLTGRSQEA